MKTGEWNDKLLGGIGKLGGKAMNVALKNLDKVDDIFARFARSPGGKYILSIASEGGEEYLQSFLEPYLWSAVSGEPVTQDWEENLYSGLQGMISAAFFESSSLISPTDSGPPMGLDESHSLGYNISNNQGCFVNDASTQGDQTLYRRDETTSYTGETGTQATDGNRSGIQEILGEAGAGS